MHGGCGGWKLSITLRWANWHFLCSVNLTAVLSNTHTHTRTSSLLFAHWWDQNFSSGEKDMLLLPVSLPCVPFRWMLEGFSASVWNAQMRFTVETARGKILLAFQRKRGWLLIEWRSCFVLRLQWKSSTRWKAIYVLGKKKKQRKSSTSALSRRKSF